MIVLWIFVSVILLYLCLILWTGYTEADVNPIFIRDFLGHTDLKVTEIYSKTSIKMKKAALDKMNSGKTVIPDKPAKDWTDDNSLFDWLNGLKR